MRPVILPLALVLASALGACLGYAAFAYPPIDIDAIREYAETNNSVNIPWYSKVSPPEVINGGRTVLVTISCDPHAPYRFVNGLVRSFPGIHFVVDTPVEAPGEDSGESPGVPCISEQERLGLPPVLDGARRVIISEGASTEGCAGCHGPANITVRAGETVQWINEDTATHAITSDGVMYPPTRTPQFGNPTFLEREYIWPGATYWYTFVDPGTYEYGCKHHPWFRATVTVE